MRRPAAWALLPALLLAAGARGEVYYASRGVPYHIGPKGRPLPEDAPLKAFYPVVGTQWVRRFTVDKRVKVRVRIGAVWGVDDCAYCKDMIWVDDRPMGRLFGVDNHRPFATPDELAVTVDPGRLHEVRIASEGTTDFDDFMIKDIVVETAGGGLRFVGPPVMSSPAPASPPAPRPPAGGCGGTALDGWLPPEPVVLESPADYRGLDGARALAEGRYAQLWFKVDSVADVDAVGQALELRLGDGDGWVLSWAQGRDLPVTGNPRLAGRYRAGSFAVSGYRPGAWNLLRVARCGDRRARLSLNGVELGPALPVGTEELDVEVGVVGLDIRVQEAE